MKLITYAQQLHDLSVARAAGVSDIILGHKDYSRFGKLSSEEFEILATRARELGLKVIFEWDILMTENDFARLSSKLPDLLNLADSLRVQDPGALEWALRQSCIPLQFIAENGNHNLPGLKAWIEYAAGRLEQIILSIELPKDKIQEYCRSLTVPCELLGLGRILLFYTPRLLLSPLSSEKIALNEEIAAIGESEESPHKGFPIIENKHGTFMFHIKDFCLIDFAQELKSNGLGLLRVDLRWSEVSQLPAIAGMVEALSEDQFAAFKLSYSQDLMRGFYHVNKSDVLFGKLKNHRLQKREGSYVGEVVEAEKGSHLAIRVKNSRGLKKTDRLKVIHPKGDEFEISIYSLRDLSLKEIDCVPAGRTALIQFVGGVWVKSQVFYRD